jgi:predicted DNA-binding transcriptional regulator AlpA
VADLLTHFGFDPPEDDVMEIQVEHRTYDYDDVCSFHRITRQTAYRWVKLGQIPSPVYQGTAARWTAEQWEIIKGGVRPTGTFPVAKSPRADIKRRSTQEQIDAAVAAARAEWERELEAKKPAKKPAAKKPAAKKPAAKKPAAKKGGAK